MEKPPFIDFDSERIHYTKPFDIFQFIRQGFPCALRFSMGLLTGAQRRFCFIFLPVLSLAPEPVLPYY
jgi:hypothetical protein